MKKDNTFAAKAVQYFCGLKEPENLPFTIQVMNPYSSPNVKSAVKQFYNKYYADNKKRIYIFGINPGRFGGGLTGISFTDPVALRIHCGINNSFSDKKELSSEFIYKVIEEFGGASSFFAEFYLTALYPLAIIKKEKNYNYYDDPLTWQFFEPQIKTSLKQQLSFGAVINFAVCLGIKNYRYLKVINDQLGVFKKIVVLDHPRYIMQYRRKNVDGYIKAYINVLRYKQNDEETGI